MGIETEHDDENIVDRIRAAFAQAAGERSNQSIIIDNGKYLAVIVVLAVVCGFCANVSWTIQKDYRNDRITLQDEYQKERNHVIELEARLGVAVDEIRELKHERR